MDSIRGGYGMKRRHAAGFTLIELMIVVAVIAILGAIAYPSYQDYVRKGKRAEGRAALLRTAQLLERWYSDKSTYATTPATAPTALDLAPLFGLAANADVYSGENPADVKSPYKVKIAAETGACPKEACYLLTTELNPPFTDAVCGNFTLNSVGTRSWTNASDTSTTGTCKW